MSCLKQVKNKSNSQNVRLTNRWRHKTKWRSLLPWQVYLKDEQHSVHLDLSLLKAYIMRQISCWSVQWTLLSQPAKRDEISSKIVKFNRLVWWSLNSFSPWQCCIMLHKHNNELCYLDQRKSLSQAVQFAGKLHGKKEKELQCYLPFNKQIKQLLIKIWT